MCENNTSVESLVESLAELDITYTLFEGILAILIVIGNSLVIFVFFHENKLWKRSNFYVISLAIGDFCVGLFAIPCAIMVDDEKL